MSRHGLATRRHRFEIPNLLPPKIEPLPMVQYQLLIKPFGQPWREVGLFASRDCAERVAVCLGDDHADWLPMQCQITLGGGKYHE